MKPAWDDGERDGCRGCGVRLVQGQRCEKCAVYYRRHGRERPREFWPHQWGEPVDPATVPDEPTKRGRLAALLLASERRGWR